MIFKKGTAESMYLIAFGVIVLILIVTTSIKPSITGYAVYGGEIGTQSVCDSNISACKSDGWHEGLTYCLNSSAFSTISCMIIRNNSVTLDCQGNTLTGDGAGNDYGALINAFTNVTVKNCIISNFSYGVYIFSSSGNEVINSTIVNSTDGIRIESASSNRILDNIIDSNAFGLSLITSNTNFIKDNIITSNDDGIFISGVSGNSIFLNNSILTHANYTIYDSSGGGTLNKLIYNNSFGEIKWINSFLQNITTKGNLVFPGNITIGNNSVSFNPEGFTGNINSSANITLYLIGWSFSNPIILKNGVQCTGCYNFTSLDAYKVIFNVSSWSNYSIGNGPNSLPFVSSIILNATDPSTNNTDQNLTLWFDSSDLDGDEVKNITNWYVNSTPVTIINLPFEAGSSNSTWTKDYSSRGKNATVSQALWNATGGYDSRGAYWFDGSNDYIQLESYPQNKQTEELAIELRFKRLTDSGNFERLITAEVGGLCNAPYYIHLYGATDIIQFGVGDGFGGFVGVAQSPASSINLNTWYHVVASYNKNKSELKFFLNGVKYTNTSALTGSAPSSAGTWMLGRNSPCGANGYKFNGFIDDVKIYNRSLSDEQILALYNKQLKIVSNETTPGDTWKACVTPNDNTQDGVESCSNDVTITAPGTIPPSITSIITNPTLPFINNGSEQNISINFSSSEYPINIIFYLENSTDIVTTQGLTAITSSSQIPTNFTIPGSLDEGVYFLYMNATDSNNNTNISFIGNFTVTLPDTTPPVITSTSPTNGASLAAGTTSVTIQLTTNETSECRYNTTNESWINMTVLTNTNSTSHNFTVNVSDGTTYDYYFLCQDNATTPNLMNSSYYLQFSVASPGGGGGGGGGTTPQPEPEPEPTVIEPEGPQNTYTPTQVSHIRSATRLNYTEKLDGKGNISLRFINRGNKSIKNISISIEEPSITEFPNSLHIRKLWGWEWLKLIGWIAKRYVREAQVFEWKISKPTEYDILRPGESIDLDFNVNPPPLTKAQVAELTLKISSYGQPIYVESIPVRINTTEFVVIADNIPDENLADIYMVVSNLEKEENTYIVELNFNKGSWTTGAEVFGPYKIPPNDTRLFTYRYEYLDEFADDYFLRYKLRNEEGKLKEVVGQINLTKE